MGTKTAVVTGATSGLGQAAALALGAAGWRVLVVGRDAGRGAEVAKQAGNGSEFVKADLFSLADVRRLAGVLAEKAPALDLLVNNAGGVFSKGPATVDGLEQTFALNVAAPFTLTEGLLGALEAGKGRVVNVVTGIQNGFSTKLEQVVGPKATGGMFAYVRNKAVLLTLTRAQQQRHGARGITFVALHPGIIPTTRFGQSMTGFNPFTTIGPFFSKLFGIGVTEAVAASRYVKVGTEAVEGGGYYYEGVLRPAPKQALDQSFVDSVWSLVATEVQAGKQAA
ncbi:MAG: SDR family NAD(P)-dependent oxidoreductase [Archangiaceae bacterium]|nr:SDR family NAD(P)-dependent oxidoreductase [Archangiaceae bacterium]